MRPGEAGTALLMLANLFLLLVGYYILKTVREPLVLVGGGAEMKSYASAGMAVALMGFIPLYGWLAKRFDRMKLIVFVIVFFVVCLELFYVAGLARVPYVGLVFFVWVGIFNNATIAQFWSYANDVYRREVGERLFPVIAIGATAGSPLGAGIAERLFDARISPYAMMQITAAILLAHLVLYRLVNRRVSGHGPAQAEGAALSGPSGFALVFANPYIRLIAVLVVLLNIVNTTGEYIVDRFALTAAKAAVAADPALTVEAFIGSFKGSYFFWVNLGAVVIQAFLTSRLVKYAGVAGVILALPLVSMGTYGLATAGVTFAAMRWAKTAENAMDYSVMNTGRQMLWLPTSRDEKYKAKQAVDTFFVRFGDVLSAALVYGGTMRLGLDVGGFARANIVLILIWLGVAAPLLGRYRALSQKP